MDTIYALATARSKAGLAVVRVSGPAAYEIGERLAPIVPMDRYAAFRQFSWRGIVLDKGIAIKFAAGSSFTGDETVEFYLHGSMAVITAFLKALSEQPEARMAEPGEFTRRALENGNLDLTQVEGLADLLDAETEAQRRQALRILDGELGRKVSQWRDAVVRASAMAEATIDFSDQDIPDDQYAEIQCVISDLVNDLETELIGHDAAERIRDGFEVAIVGAPNVGKSTLLNALLGRNAALTSELPGTTRDVIEVRLDVGGLPVTLLDTAGIRVSSDTLETMGIELAKGRASRADLRVFLDGHDPKMGIAVIDGDLFIKSKADLRNDGDGVSGLTGQGISSLLTSIEDILRTRVCHPSVLTRERHRTCIVNAVELLHECTVHLSAAQPRIEVVALLLRQANIRISFLVGEVDVEDVLSEIFSRFCVGK